ATDPEWPDKPCCRTLIHPLPIGSLLGCQFLFLFMPKDDTSMNKALSMLLATTVLFGCSDVKEKQFIAGCQSSGAPTQVCECIADELDGNFEHPTERDLIDASFACRKTFSK
ncbi:hypothetical protein, partial [Aeromonas salmonicida]